MNVSQGGTVFKIVVAVSILPLFGYRGEEPLSRSLSETRCFQDNFDGLVFSCLDLVSRYQPFGPMAVNGWNPET